jgi:GMP synthase (glutamine-hydrolysing)
MNIVILQHSNETPLGSVADWLKLKSHNPTIVKLFEGAKLPDLKFVDWLIILGGPMNVDDVELYPWLTTEKDYLRQAIAQHKTCLGLCLGGQLLAQTLGAEVRKHTHWEIGWHPVFFGHNGNDRLTVFQWHQDTFDLPNDAVRVATNRICENQGFMYGDNIVGLQFHPEATEEWIHSCLADGPLPEGHYVQKTESMLEDMVFIGPMRKWFFSLLDRLETVAQTAAQR